MLIRAVMVWCALLVTAIINGSIREAWLNPRFGTAVGHVLSTVMLSAAILALAWLAMPRVGTSRPVAVGLLRVRMTVAFEFLAGHYLFGHSWSRLLADYNLAAGRVWLLVLVTTALAPWLAVRFRG